jgi:Zn-dependent protease with chaperone function
MKHTFLLAFSWLLGSLMPVLQAQGLDQYQPVSLSETLPADLEAKTSARLKSDIAGIRQKGKVKKELKKVYTQRYETLMNSVESGEFLFDNRFYPYCQAIFDRVLAANPTIPRQEVHLLLGRSPVPNASCWGEGSIVLNIGLISRLDNEAQIAFALAHELAHYTQDHVNTAMVTRAERRHSRAAKAEVAAIEQSEYYRTSRLMDLKMRNVFERNRHSRLRELEADSLGLIYYLNSGYAPNEALSLLGVLDAVDAEKYTSHYDLRGFLEEVDFDYQAEWVEYQPDTTFYYSKSPKAWADSLKTHPDCAQRLTQAAQYLSRVPTSAADNPTSFSDISVKKLSDIMDLELLFSHYYFQHYGRLIHEGIKLLSVYPNNFYVKGMVALTVMELYEQKKAHALSEVLDRNNPAHPQDEDETLHFLNSLRLKHLQALGDALITHWEADIPMNESLLYAAILSAHHQQDLGLRNQRIDRYWASFPEGRHARELRQRFP